MNLALYQIRGFLIMVAAVATAVLAIGAAAVFVGDLLPYAKQAEFSTLTAQVVKIDVRTWQFHVDALLRQRYEARKACRSGGEEACDDAEDLTRQIDAARVKLRQARGF
jgi:hypothetical protein